MIVPAPKDAPRTTSIAEVSPNKDEDATPAPVFVKIGRKRFPLSTGYGGRLKSDQEACDDMWQICKNCTYKEILVWMSDAVKAKAEASADKTS